MHCVGQLIQGTPSHQEPKVVNKTVMYSCVILHDNLRNRVGQNWHHRGNQPGIMLQDNDNPA